MDGDLFIASPEDFAADLDAGDYFATLTGRITGDAVVNSVLVNELAVLNRLIRNSLRRMGVSGDSLFSFAEKTCAFFEARFEEEFADFPDEPEQIRVVTTLKSAAFAMDFSYDWIEMALSGETDGWQSLEALEALFQLCNNRDIMLLAVSLATIALSYKLFQIKEVEVALFAAFFATKTVYGVANRLSGYEESKSESGKHAVDHRPDQILMKNWKEHCTRVYQSGADIKILGDLLDVEGYDPDLMKQKPTTLKKWAKAAVPGLRFQRGRPAKKK